MLEQAMDAVQEFHYDKGISQRCEMPRSPLSSERGEINVKILACIGCLHDLTTLIEQRELGGDSDPRWLRIHLVGEEFTEFLTAIMEGDTLGVLDAMADLVVVIAGTAVMFDLPLSEAFEEVMRSNMTKARRVGPRLRVKGDSYEPPNLQAVLDHHNVRHTAMDKFDELIRKLKCLKQ